jgi:hypothetical protein
MFRRGIAGAIQVGAGLTLAALVALILWAALGALGDSAGAAVARGVSWGLVIAWGANLVVLVVLLALAELSSFPEPDPGQRRQAAERPDH